MVLEVYYWRENDGREKASQKESCTGQKASSKKEIVTLQKARKCAAICCYFKPPRGFSYCPFIFLRDRPRRLIPGAKTSDGHSSNGQQGNPQSDKAADKRDKGSYPQEQRPQSRRCRL